MPKLYPTVDDKRAHMKRKLDQIIDVLGEETTVRLIPNPMASGPCPACLSAAERPVLAINAPLMPFKDCPHPDQCVGFYSIDSYHLDDDDPSQCESLWSHLKRFLFGQP